MLDPLLWRWQDEYLLFPMVRNAVAHMANTAAWMAVLAAALAVAELALLVIGLPIGLLCGAASALCAAFLLGIVGLLLPWCQIVLFAERGYSLTRYLFLFLGFFTLCHVVCTLYQMLASVPLLPQQWQLPLILPPLLLITAGANWNKTAALPTKTHIRIAMSFLFYTLAMICDIPAMLPVCLIFKIICAVLAFRPLRQLAALAPRVIDLPPLRQQEE